MVDHPGDYPCSSFRFNGEGEENAMLSPHSEYLRLGMSASHRQLNYKALFDAHLEPCILDEIRSSTNGNYVLCNERFKQEIANMLKCRVSPGKAKAGRPVKENVN